MNDVTTRVAEIATRASALYSRPTVALEIVRLAGEPQVDPREIKECLERDPALACRILRVVNSSFFGVRREIADLGQALNVLGIKPLKLLVLGFSLPDELFAQMAAEQLQWYWTTTLTRAVAARLLATELWHQDGDEAFLAGLMQDIGILALLREFGPPYAKLLSGVIHQRSDLAALERDSLGFDHVELTAALLDRWQLPRRLVDAIAAPKKVDRLTRSTANTDLPKILHLAELLAQLVGQLRTSVLPELMEAGGEYQDLTKGRLQVLVEKLQPQVHQLADALSLELPRDRNYVEVLASAQKHMASLSEELAGNLAHHRSEDQAYTELLHEAQELTVAMQEFLYEKQQPRPDEGVDRTWHSWHAPHDRTQGERGAAQQTEGALEDSVGIVSVLRRLSTIVPLCRVKRHELSLLMMEYHFADVLAATGDDVLPDVRQALIDACYDHHDTNVEVLSITATQLALILPNCERRQAVAIANDVLAKLSNLAPSQDTDQVVHELTVSAGVATVGAVPKNFDPWRLVESAERCLNAARSSNTNAVKSIEI
jgi:HD-like signal output (HDOD) protein/GGDEF domain-containing protein